MIRLPWTKCKVEMPVVKKTRQKSLFKIDESMPIRAIRFSDSGDRNMILQFRGADGQWKAIPQVTIDRKTGKEIYTT